jgi:hypothetical protein
VDLDVKFLFTKNGRRLSLLEFYKASQDGGYQMKPLAAAAGIAVGHFKQDGYDYSLFMESAFSSEAWLRRWYKRIMQIPFIFDETGRYSTCSPAQRRKAKRLYPKSPEIHLPPAQFAGRFYAN